MAASVSVSTTELIGVETGSPVESDSTLPADASVLSGINNAASLTKERRSGLVVSPSIAPLIVGVTSANTRSESAVNFKPAEVSGTNIKRLLENTGSLISVGEMASPVNIVGRAVESGTTNKACVLTSASSSGEGGN